MGSTTAHPLRAVLRALALLPGLLTLAACTTLGPDYEQPRVEWVADWQPDLYGQAAAPEAGAEEDLRFWWAAFDDPVLNRLIALAKAENVSLQIAGLRILESRAALGIADSTRYPQMQQVTAGAAYTNSWRDGADRQALWGYQAGFDLGWELDFWGRFRRSIESADAAFFASIANQRDAQVLLSAAVADLYFTYRATQLRIGIARENAAIQERSYEITERVFKSGQKGELDLQQARTQYLGTLSTVPNLESTLVQTRNALCALIGRPPGDLPELDGVLQRLPAAEQRVIHDMPARLLMRRPDIRAAAARVAAQSAQIGIAEADYYPAIALGGTIGWSGNSLDGSPNVLTLGLGPALTWNIFDHGRIANNIRVQDARLQQLIEQYRDTVTQAAREIDDAAIAVVKTAERQRILDEAENAARRSLEIANTLYREGYADFNRVLDAQRALFAQQEGQLVNQASHVSAVISLYKALGGGWQEGPEAPFLPEGVLNTMEQRSDWGGLLRATLPTGPYHPTPAFGAETYD